MAKKIMNLFWPLIIGTTMILYFLILVTLPFSTTTATIFLFALIAYWSRIPGVGIPSPFFILYRADIVDLLSILIAINIGPVQGSLFSIFGNLWSRVAGVTPYWRGVIKDASIQGVICFFMPVIYELFNHNIFHTVLVFTLLHRLGFFIYHLVLPDFSNFEFVIVWTGATGSIFFVNYIYGKYFGEFFDGLLKTGVQFNWTLFTIATIIIVFLWFYFFKKDSDPDKKSYSEKIEGWVKLRIYLFVSSIKQKNVRDIITAAIRHSNNSENLPDFQVKTKKKKTEDIPDLMQISNPEDIALSFFENSNDEAVLKGKSSAFNLRVFFIIISTIIVACIFNKYTPNLLEVIIALGFGIMSVVFVIVLVKNFVPLIIRILGSN